MLTGGLSKSRWSQPQAPRLRHPWKEEKKGEWVMGDWEEEKVWIEGMEEVMNHGWNERKNELIFVNQLLLKGHPP